MSTCFVLTGHHYNDIQFSANCVCCMESHITYKVYIQLHKILWVSNNLVWDSIQGLWFYSSVVFMVYFTFMNLYIEQSTLMFWTHTNIAGLFFFVQFIGLQCDDFFCTKSGNDCKIYWFVFWLEIIRFTPFIRQSQKLQ